MVSQQRLLAHRRIRYGLGGRDRSGALDPLDLFPNEPLGYVRDSLPDRTIPHPNDDPLDDVFDDVIRQRSNADAGHGTALLGRQQRRECFSQRRDGNAAGRMRAARLGRRRCRQRRSSARHEPRRCARQSRRWSGASGGNRQRNCSPDRVRSVAVRSAPASPGRPVRSGSQSAMPSGSDVDGAGAACRGCGTGSRSTDESRRTGSTASAPLTPAVPKAPPCWQTPHRADRSSPRAIRPGPPGPASRARPGAGDAGFAADWAGVVDQSPAGRLPASRSFTRLITICGSNGLTSTPSHPTARARASSIGSKAPVSSSTGMCANSLFVLMNDATS